MSLPNSVLSIGMTLNILYNLRVQSDRGRLSRKFSDYALSIMEDEHLLFLSFFNPLRKGDHCGVGEPRSHGF